MDTAQLGLRQVCKSAWRVWDAFNGAYCKYLDTLPSKYKAQQYY